MASVGESLVTAIRNQSEKSQRRNGFQFENTNEMKASACEEEELEAAFFVE